MAGTAAFESGVPDPGRVNAVLSNPVFRADHDPNSKLGKLYAQEKQAYGERGMVFWIKFLSLCLLTFKVESEDNEMLTRFRKRALRIYRKNKTLWPTFTDFLFFLDTFNQRNMQFIHFLFWTDDKQIGSVDQQIAAHATWPRSDQTFNVGANPIHFQLEVFQQ